MSEVFGYGIAHKYTGEQYTTAGRKVYDSKNAASQALSRARKCWDKDSEDFRAYGYYSFNPHEAEVVELVCYAPAE